MGGHPGRSVTHSTWEDGLYCSERLASVDSACGTPSHPSFLRPCSRCSASPGPHGRPSSRSQPRVFLLGSPVGSGSFSVHSGLFLTSLLPQAGRKPLSKLGQVGQSPVASHRRSLPASGVVMQPLRQDQVPWCCWPASSPWGRVLSLSPWVLPRPIFSVTLVFRGQDDIQGKRGRGTPSLGSWWRALGAAPAWGCGGELAGVGSSRGWGAQGSGELEVPRGARPRAVVCFSCEAPGAAVSAPPLRLLPSAVVALWAFCRLDSAGVGLEASGQPRYSELGTRRGRPDLGSG